MKKVTFKAYRVVLNRSSADFHIWKSKNGRGSTLFYETGDKYKILFISSHYHLNEVINLFNEQFITSLFDAPENATKIESVFTLFLYDRQNHTMEVFTDRIGVMPVYFNSVESTNPLFCFSSLVSLVSDSTGLPLEPDKQGLRAHLGFGYHVSPHPFLYRYMRKAAPSSSLKFVNGDFVGETQYWKFPDIKTEFNLQKLIEVNNHLKDDIHRIKKPVLIGLTAGKDSLVLAALAKRCKNISGGSYGKKYSSDVIQGKRIAGKTGIKHQYYSLTSKDEFLDIAEHISYYSSGMGTLSYVDMMKMCISYKQKDFAFLMGEGGECVRDFFIYQSKPGTNPLAKYITPFNYMKDIIPMDDINTEEDYIGFLFGEDWPEFNEEFLIDFYRKGRMPGNFSIRSSMLLPLADKIVPFLNHSFIEYSYNLNREYFKGSKVHRLILEQQAPELLDFFDNPDRTEPNCQNWNARFSNSIGNLLLHLIESHGDSMSEFLNTDKIKEICRNQIEKPDRGIYMLFRIVSLMIFMNQFPELTNRFLCSDNVSELNV